MPSELPSSPRRLTFDCRHQYPSGFVLEAGFESDAAVTAIVGPSGSGKSTILSIIAGILRPQRGKVVMGDRVLLDTAVGLDVPAQRRRVAIVFQELLLFPHLSVRQNLLYGWKRVVARNGDHRPPPDLAQAAGLLEIGELLDRFPHTLSVGQKQRVAIGRALLSAPELLILDEPLAALDQDLRLRIADDLKRLLAQTRVPAILVSHQQADVERLASKIITVEAGKVV